jgi:hypothetical protein
MRDRRHRRRGWSDGRDMKANDQPAAADPGKAMAILRNDHHGGAA